MTGPRDLNAQIESLINRLQVATFDDPSAEDGDKDSITDDEEEEEEIKSKSSSQKIRTYSFYSTASMINLLGDGPPTGTKETSMDFDRKQPNILLISTAAKHHSKPVVVCTGLYKLSPLYPYDEDSFNDLVAPDPVLSFNEVTLLNPYYDYVSPELEKIPSNDKEVFVSGVEIYEYHDFDRDLLNVYISKVDTTGYRPCSSTPTKNLLTAYMKFYLEETNVNRQLLLKRKTIKFNIFARPHPQYLFHLSEKNPTKRVLNDSELLKWWKNVLQQTFLHNTICNSQEKTRKERGWFFFPGMSSEKIARTFIKDIVNGEAENRENLFWQYGYPYPDAEEAIKVIPRFEDDAKSRWLDTARESSLTVKTFWELISIGGEFAGGKQAGFFWVEVALDDNQGLANKDIETIPIIDQSFNMKIKKELEKEVGGVVVSAHTYVQALGELFAQEFHSEETAIESTSYWCRYFTGLQDKINPENLVIKFTVNNSTTTHNDGQKLNTTPVNNLQMHIKRKASSSVQNDSLNSKIDSNVNVLPLSSIKRVKK
ncbi:11741_t:CDS:2 [Racocetra fulgida]|uniref:histone acetyltransferase n=1 Tax=Racocetra fulgida TaxID=60492 RepID=A0A9N9ASA3_9GLOM|nr:11741_t:CDS:2 [Racocetra fulgida]